ncbi:MAG: hypothetical protein AAGK14_01815 [Verrucomicrobiota bacterium]
MDELSRVEFLTLIVVLTAITSAGVFFLLWVIWLRQFQKRIERLGESLQGGQASPVWRVNASPRPAEEEAEGGELLATFKLSNSNHTVSILEEDGKRVVRVDGELTDEERDQMLRYLKNEGFLG